MKAITTLLIHLCCLSLLAQNGKIDTSFGFIRLPNTKQIRAVKLQSDGGVVVVGNSAYNQYQAAYMGRYSSYGAFLSSTTMTPSTPIAYAIDTVSSWQSIAACTALDSPDHIYFIINSGSYIDYVMPRYFGIQELDIFDLKTQPNGDILVCGRCKIGGLNQFFIARFGRLLMGSIGLDVAFGYDGIVTLPFGTDAQARSLGLQSDGKIIVAGHEIAPDRYATVVRLRPNGSVDTSFNSGRGYVQSSLSSPNNYWEYYTVSVDAQDVIYCGGTSSSGAVWSTFSRGGRLLYNNFSNGNDKAYFTSSVWGHTLFEGGIDSEYGQNVNSLSSSQMISDPQGSSTFRIDTSFVFARDYRPLSTRNTNAIYGSCFNKDGNLFVCGTFNDQGFIALLKMDKHYTSVTEAAAPFASSLYPNPTSGVLHVQTEERLSDIDILSITGQQVMHATGDNKDIDLSGLADGSYLIALHSAKGQTTYSRFVKTAQ